MWRPPPAHLGHSNTLLWPLLQSGHGDFLSQPSELAWLTSHPALLLLPALPGHQTTLCQEHTQGLGPSASHSSPGSLGPAQGLPRWSYSQRCGPLLQPLPHRALSLCPAISAAPVNWVPHEVGLAQPPGAPAWGMLGDLWGRTKGRGIIPANPPLRQEGSCWSLWQH